MAKEIFLAQKVEFSLVCIAKFAFGNQKLEIIDFCVVGIVGVNM
jgi:hypothetical protein